MATRKYNTIEEYRASRNEAARRLRDEKRREEEEQRERAQQTLREHSAIKADLESGARSPRINSVQQQLATARAELDELLDELAAKEDEIALLEENSTRDKELISLLEKELSQCREELVEISPPVPKSPRVKEKPTREPPRRTRKIPPENSNLGKFTRSPPPLPRFSGNEDDAL